MRLKVLGSAEDALRAMTEQLIEKMNMRGISPFHLASCPRFDAIILGIGEDGHTASIFPSTPELLTAKCCYKVSQHPESGQKRITMTGSLILNAKLLLIPVLGNAKTSILQRVINAEEN